MSESKGRTVGRAITLLLVVAASLGIYNVLADNAEVVALAETTACGKTKCSLAMTKMMRHPFGQSFTFQTNANGGTANVGCRRAFYLLGAYRCIAE